MNEHYLIIHCINLEYTDILLWIYSEKNHFAIAKNWFQFNERTIAYLTLMIMASLTAGSPLYIIIILDLSQ